MTTTYSTTVNPTAKVTSSVPEGWTTTVVVCTACSPSPTTVTLTVPYSNTPMSALASQTSSLSSSANSASSLASSSLVTAGPADNFPALTYTTLTEYSTQQVTIISCAPTVTNCPAQSTLVFPSIIPIMTTVSLVGESNSASPASIGFGSSPVLSSSASSELAGSSFVQAISAQSSEPATSSTISSSGSGAQYSPSPVNSSAAASSTTIVSLTSQLAVYSTAISSATVVCPSGSDCRPSSLADKEASPATTSTDNMQFVTMTIVPVPKYSTQSANVSSAPYGVSNATSLNVGPAASTTQLTLPAAPVFTGAGSKKSTGALGVFTVMLVTILMA